MVAVGRDVLAAAARGSLGFKGQVTALLIAVTLTLILTRCCVSLKENDTCHTSCSPLGVGKNIHTCVERY